MEFTQITPESGWVLHNPDEIYYTVLEVIKAVINESNINPNEIDSIGITNQRETSVIWDKDNYESIYPAIVWQSRQSEDICQDLRQWKKRKKALGTGRLFWCLTCGFSTVKCIFPVCFFLCF